MCGMQCLQNGFDGAEGCADHAEAKVEGRLRHLLPTLFTGVFALVQFVPCGDHGEGDDDGKEAIENRGVGVEPSVLDGIDPEVQKKKVGPCGVVHAVVEVHLAKEFGEIRHYGPDGTAEHGNWGDDEHGKGGALAAGTK